MEDILSNLTPQQLEAVTHRDGPMLVVAGAGSGKTRVVTRRIAWLISQGVWPSQILAMTFTNKAAREMRQRVQALTGQIPYNIGTFHSCCARFLRRDIGVLQCGRDGNFTIYDTDDQKSLLKTCITHALEGRRLDVLTPGLMQGIISTAKNTRACWEELCGDEDIPELTEIVTTVATTYEEHLRQNNAVDFDDLLLLFERLLAEHPDMADIYQARFRYLLVDEYQDTNRLQYELIMRLTGENRNVHVTGDPDQAIYSWRGADYQNIMSFTQDFPDAKVVKLERNYRSTPAILQAANAVIVHNSCRIDKELFTNNPDGLPVTVVAVQGDKDEAEWIRRKLQRVIENGYKWSDCAILYRTNSQSRVIEEELVRRRVPYQLLGGLRFYDRREIKDFMAILRLRVNSSDEMALKRIFDGFPCTNGLGPKTMTTLRNDALLAQMGFLEYMVSEECQAKHCRGRSVKAARLRALSEWCGKLLQVPLQPLEAAVRKLDDVTEFSQRLEKQYGEENLDARKENVESFIQRAAIFQQDFPDADLTQYLQDVALVADVDAHDDSVDKVTLMTLHAAKGLEFPLVFIAGMEEGLLPHQRALDEETPEAIEEERRLFYVGITRAQQALYLSRAAQRFKWGENVCADASRFLRELPGDGQIRKLKYLYGREILDNGKTGRAGR